ncbi:MULTISPECIES: ABC transporter permease [unclassified Streptomyces]|uniref:ABC transporter permease n=1 Tax=unclassified Streptomyces TaxID=2593676 RepID=UPI0004C1E3DD|nr:MULTISPECIES: FtsX-like permease family protein [unclassified Streptomyces]
MLSIAVGTLRTRWSSFVGSFVALALGVALIAVMGAALAASLDAPERRPERFATAPVVVQGAHTLRVPTAHGVRSKPLARPRPVPARTVAALRRLGTVVEDRTFPVRVMGGPSGVVGHPWPTAAYAPYTLAAGRAPTADDEVAATGDWTRVGARLRTPDGTVRVVGTLAVGRPGSTGAARGAPARTFETALFYTGRRAARLSPAALQLVVDAPAGAVRRAVRDTDGVRVLTGDARRLADADPDRDTETLAALNALFGTAGGVSGFVSVFVVASMFAFAVAGRRRELGLLRTVGATPGQVRRLVLTEALLVGVLASAAGCALGAWGAPHLAGWVVDADLAPEWFTVGGHAWPYQVAFWTGLTVACAGAATAAVRAGRVRPAQALREAAVDRGTLPWSRRLTGAALLLTAAVTLVLALRGDPGELLHRKTYVSRPMLLISAVAVVSPALVGPLVRLLTALPARLPSATGMLVREGVAAGARRAASVVAPVLVTVALAGSLLGATGMLNAAKATELRAHTADFVLAPASSTDGFDEAALRRLRSVPGAVVSATAGTQVYVLEDGVALIGSEARAVDPAALAATVRLPVTAGRLSALDDDSIVVNEEWARHTVGQRVTVWRGDGTRRTLRIAAVLATGTGDNGAYVTPANAPGAPVDRVDVGVAEGADAAAVARSLRAAAEATGARVSTRAQWVSAHAPHTTRTTRLGYALVLGIALLYTGISLTGTLAMATAARTRDLRSLRLTGATRAQLLRLATAETLTLVATGTVLALVTTAADLTTLHLALTLQSAPAPLTFPWRALTATTAACAVLATAATLLPTALTLRRNAPAR